MDPIILGISLVTTGALLFLTSRVFLRSVPDAKPLIPLQSHLLAGDKDLEHNEAVLVIQTGGRVIYTNRLLRDYFNLQPSEQINLERLARQARPSDLFLKLCASEGKSQLSIGGRSVDATSFLLVVQPVALMIMTLHYPEQRSESITKPGNTSHLLKTLLDFSHDLGSSIELTPTIKTILQNLEKTTPADYIELTLLEPSTNLLIPYHLVGSPDGDRRVEITRPTPHESNNFAYYLANQKQSFYISDIQLQSEIPFLPSQSVPYRSYLGAPLLCGNELIGTLALCSLAGGYFQKSDLELLQLFASTSAAALQNAQKYQAEQDRSAMMSTIAQFNQSLSSIRDSNNLISSLVPLLTPLFHVDVLGFITYNSTEHTLEGQSPFHGLPPQFIELYRIFIQNNAAEQIILDQKTIVTENAADDDNWELLGLSSLAMAASLRETILQPITSGGRMLGYLQISNHSDGSRRFNSQECELVFTAASQVAPLIENDYLVQQNRHRAQRSETLRRISNLTTSSTPLDDIIRVSIQELARLFKTNSLFVLLINPTLGELQIHNPSLTWSIPNDRGINTSLRIDDAQYLFSICGRQTPLISGHLSEEKTIIPFYQKLFTACRAESALAAPMVARDKSIGEIWVTNQQRYSFNQADQQFLITIASLLSGVVEQGQLGEKTDEHLRTRVDQLTSITRLNRELNNTNDIQTILQLVYDEALRLSGADCGTIELFHSSLIDTNKFPVRFFAGDTPSNVLSQDEQKVVEKSVAFVIPDTKVSETTLPHSDIISLLIIPITHLQVPLGLLILHSKKPGTFTRDSVDITQMLINQATSIFYVALQQELRFFEEKSTRFELDVINHLFQITAELHYTRPLQDQLTMFCTRIKLATPFKTVGIGIYDPATRFIREAAGDTIQINQAELQESTAPWSAYQNLFQIAQPIGNNAYRLTSEDIKGKDWQEDDILLIPITRSDGVPLALISLSQSVDIHIPQEHLIDALELFTPLIGFTIENHRYLNTQATNLADLEDESNRLRQSLTVTQQQMPLLLHKDLEQTISIQNLLRQLGRTRNGIEVASLGIGQKDIQTFTKTLVLEMLPRFEMHSALIAHSTPGGLKLVEALGYIPDGSNPEIFFGQHTPLQAVEKDKQPILVENIVNHPHWINNALLNSLKAKSFLCLLLTINETNKIVILLVGQKPVSVFSEDDQRIFAQLSRQVSITLQNQELLNETRQRLHEVDLLLDFSRKIGSLEPITIFNALLSSAAQAISGAQAGWVGDWNPGEQRLSPKSAYGYNDVSSLLKINFAEQPGEASGAILTWRVFQSGNVRRMDEIDFPQDYNLSAEHLEFYRKATAGRLPVSSLLVPLKRGENKLGILVLNNFEYPSMFNEQDERLILSLTQQAALALESAHLYQAAEKRTNQLQALTKAGGSIASRLESEELINSLLDELEEVISYDTATLWLRENNQVTIAAAKGFPDNESRLGIFTTVEDSALFQEISRSGDTLSVEDVRQDARFPTLLEPDCLSWLGIPLIAKSKLNGLIALEKREPGFYTSDLIQVVKTFASQAAIALENAHLFEESNLRAAELDLRSQRLTVLNQLSQDLGSSLEIDHILKVTSERLQNAIGGDRVSSIIIENKGQYVLRTEAPASEDILPQMLHKIPLLQRLTETRGIYSSNNIQDDPELSPLLNFFSIRHTQSVLILPLVTGVRHYGWLWLLNAEPNRYATPEIEMARTIANQAAIAVQNAISFAEARSLTEDLEQRVEERAAELRKEHENTQTLLHIITELSTSLELDQVLTRTLTVLNESLGADQSVIFIADGTSDRYQAGIPLVNPPENSIFEISPEQEISRWIIRQGESVLIDNIISDPRWEFAEAQSIPFRSLLGLPLFLGTQILGTIMLFNRESYFFKKDQVDLTEAVARQISITINNATLYDLTSDQSERLVGMLRDQEIASSRSLAILEAVADGVLVTDAQKIITLFNASAERILGLETEQVTGHSLDRFIGLFGSSARPWMKTILLWSEEPQSHHLGETYSDRINLENGRVVLVHLAPVILGLNFLGTVSIFRDITHEVQVDRLKSEFVANVSHELRTPMTSIKGYVDLLLMGAGGELNPSQSIFLDIVKNNITRLGVLVDDLLNISRIESGHITLKREPINIEALTLEILSEFTRRSHEDNKPMSFRADFAEDLPRALGDEPRIRQVITSLISNGYNYTPSGGEVDVQCKVIENQIQVDVRDNGIGIAPEDHTRIFERFYRGEDPLVLACAGTGLGLAISKIIIEMHQGNIWFDSNGIPGQGSVFSFTLPIYKVEE